jgi:hypothetical protein
MRPLVLLCTGIAACQPIPHPFSHAETGNPVTLDLPDSGGIVVLELANAPAATSVALAEAMADALAERNIPASTGSGNQRSYYLHGYVDDAGRDVVILWTLIDPRGAVVDTVPQPIDGTQPAPWAEASPALMRRLAHQSAPQIAALVQGAVPAENVVPALHVAEVAGAPGLGNRQLRSALRRHLAASGLQVTESPATDGLTVSGIVAVGPVTGDRQIATLEWLVRDAAGKEVGRIAQSNPVAAGSLDGSWGPVADNAARGAAEGITALVRRIDWTAATDADSGAPGTGREAARAQR